MREQPSLPQPWNMADITTQACIWKLSATALAQFFLFPWKWPSGFQATKRGEQNYGRKHACVCFSQSRVFRSYSDRVNVFQAPPSPVLIHAVFLMADALVLTLACSCWTCVSPCAVFFFSPRCWFFPSHFFFSLSGPKPCVNHQIPSLSIFTVVGQHKRIHV